VPEKVTIREDLQIIQIESYGEVRAEDLQGSLEAVAKIRQERGLTKVFVDATKETSFPSTFPVFEFGSALANTIRGMKFAVAASPKTDRDLRFLETVAANRGAHVSVFDSVEAALAWLIEEPSNADAGGGK
jgi:hypothetical protein